MGFLDEFKVKIQILIDNEEIELIGPNPLSH
jgi:hypothetical protein